jgi:ABC-type multidrug transport system fused ATPase/permease subunit
VCSSIYLPIYPSNYLTIYPSNYPSINLSIHLSIYLSIRCVRQSAEAEAQFTSVERIDSYTNLPVESGYSLKLNDYLTQGSSTSSSSSTNNNIINNSNSKSINNNNNNNSNNNNSNNNNSVNYAESDEGNDTSTQKDNNNNSNNSNNTNNSSNYKSNNTNNCLEIKNLSVTYRDDLDLVLEDLSITIPYGSKVGICGRTGSGKSSLLLALLRLNIITSGDVIMNGDSLLDMNLESARNQVFIYLSYYLFYLSL